MLPRSSVAVMLWLLAVVLLPARMANAHLHVCMDGQQAPVSVHVHDAASHAGVAGGEQPDGHLDLDVDLSSASPAKLSGSAQHDLLVFLPVHTVVPAPAVLAHALPDRGPITLALEPPRQLRPPVRGPPA